MAKQHFYSRVPARASIYNRCDGFDTFAHSEGLEQSFVQEELAAVCENKLFKTDLDAIRLETMPAVYSQTVLKSGQVVQSCVSYLPKDYTGERCTYLCHSLLLSEEELQTLHSGDSALLNPALFVDDLTALDLQNQSANHVCPEKLYVIAAGEDPATLADMYHENGLQAFVYALLATLCAKGKGVYFKLPGDDTQLSCQALRFLNGIAAVVPYHLRKELSFVTYVTDPAQYNHVKIKCMAANCPEPAKGKGVFVDLATGLVTGMPAADIVAKAPVEFFCTLLREENLRREFLTFVDTVVKAMPGLAKLNMKVLSELVFLFRGASGMFDQQTVLPTDEQVYELLNTYEKYREALTEAYCQNVYQCLWRYPRNHMAIPKNIFSKLSRIYPGDNPSAKRIAVGAVLELIHTDIMREKLFAFLKNNYDNEAPDIQNMIDLDLCSVFYGGFLQEQILTFFGGHFANAPEQVRRAIFEKLMLSVRTISVQEKILQFVKENYSVLSAGEKQLFYDTAYEMLPECDGLTEMLVTLLNSCLAQEEEACNQAAQRHITQLLEADYRKKEHKLLKLLCGDHGFCYELVLQLVFGPWNNRKCYQDYIQLLAQYDVMRKTRELIYLTQVISDREGELAAKLMLTVEQLYAADMDKTDLYQWLAVDALIKEEMAQYNQACAWLISGSITQKAITQQVTEVFSEKMRKDGVQTIAAYAQKNHYLEEAPQYGAVKLFLQLVKAAQEQQERALFSTLEQLRLHTALCSDMALTIQKAYLDWDRQDPQVAALYEISYNVLRNGTILSQSLYGSCKAYYFSVVREKQPKINPAKGQRMAAERTAKLIMQYVIAACDASVPLCRMACADQEGLRQFIQSFCADCGKAGGKWIVTNAQKAPASFAAAVKEASAGAKPQGGSFLSKLLRK